MSYIDGFVIPVPNDNKQAYKELAAKAAVVFKAHGATRVVECWSDDVQHGKQTDFYMAVKATENESVVFSWIEWPSKEARDKGNEAAMKDPTMPMDMTNMPFDGKRLIWGGFAPILDQ